MALIRRYGLLIAACLLMCSVTLAVLGLWPWVRLALQLCAFFTAVIGWREKRRREAV